MQDPEKSENYPEPDDGDTAEEPIDREPEDEEVDRASPGLVTLLRPDEDVSYPR